MTKEKYEQVEKAIFDMSIKQLHAKRCELLQQIKDSKDGKRIAHWWDCVSMITNHLEEMGVA